MPYIKQDRREEVNRVLEVMSDCNITANGDLNYILFAFCKYCVPESYNSIKNYIGELNETVAEIRRKILADYEDEKEKENGKI